MNSTSKRSEWLLLVRSIVASIASIAILVGVGVLSHEKARDRSEKDGPRLQWGTVAMRAIPSGARILEGDLRSGFHRTDGKIAPIASIDRVKGRFARRKIEPGVVLRAAMLADVPFVASDGFVVPVDVTPRHAAGLEPGAVILLANDEGTVLPPQPRRAPDPPSVFRVLAVVPSADARSASLLVDVAADQRSCIAALAKGTWRPVRVTR